jgi:hypothetical protein
LVYSLQSFTVFMSTGCRCWFVHSVFWYDKELNFNMRKRHAWKQEPLYPSKLGWLIRNCLVNASSNYLFLDDLWT